MKLKYRILIFIIGTISVVMFSRYCNNGERTGNLKDEYFKIGKEMYKALQNDDLNIDTLYWVGALGYEARQLDSLKQALKLQKEYTKVFRDNVDPKVTCIYNVVEVITHDQNYYIAVLNKCGSIWYRVDTVCVIRHPVIMDKIDRKRNLLYVKQSETSQ